MGIPKSKLILLASAGILALGVGATGAVAANLVTSADIKDDTVRSVDIKDGKGVKYRDLHPSVTNKFEALQDQIDALEARVADLENSSTTAEWVPNQGATIVDNTTVSLTIAEGGAPRSRPTTSTSRSRPVTSSRSTSTSRTVRPVPPAPRACSWSCRARS